MAGTLAGGALVRPGRATNVAKAKPIKPKTQQRTSGGGLLLPAID
jgi:hypothetical protein